MLDYLRVFFCFVFAKAFFGEKVGYYFEIAFEFIPRFFWQECDVEYVDFVVVYIGQQLFWDV